ncbi:hypothetical protein [Williamsia sterculiae]|uniref:Uncharacterized protein n=1 Tax=Williamsia sterculiae TaxID=1344003 RepID=A0A1N7FVA6_9NOCA|nr:hypothetical protein [Williamsia sterculiae]SIS04278.1 hypothetical protein SAMN05445060_2319 [Williamsia sterculiae]
MTDDLAGLPPAVVAALHAPEGTTTDEIRARFPDQSAEPHLDEHAFRHRLDDACYDWQVRNSWLQMPDGVRAELADSVRESMIAEQ